MPERRFVASKWACIHSQLSDRSASSTLAESLPGRHDKSARADRQSANSDYLSERMLCKDMALAYNDIAAWNYAELPRALGCPGCFTARVNTCGELDDALKTAEQADGAAYIEV